MAIGTAMQTALIGGPKGGAGGIVVLSSSAPLPQEPLESSQIAVAVKAVALNPVDSKMVGGFLTAGATLGFDAAGVVTAVGSSAADDWGYRVGDRVVVFNHGMNPKRPTVGALAEHTVSWAWATLKIPDRWSFAEGVSSMGGCAWLTVPWALFYALALPAGPALEPLHSQFPPPTVPPKINITTAWNRADGSSSSTGPPLTTVLVSGGASYTGMCAIQLLKLAGYTVVATCSARSFDAARSAGADAVFDYASPTCAEDIRAYTSNSLRLALDCITTPETTRLCYASLGRAGGRYVSLDPFAADVAAKRTAVHAGWVVAMEPLGEDIAWPAPYGRQANPTAREFCKVWNRTMQGLVDRDLIRLHPPLVRTTGLAGALEGLEELRQKRGAGRKLVYTL